MDYLLVPKSKYHVQQIPTMDIESEHCVNSKNPLLRNDGDGVVLDQNKRIKSCTVPPWVLRNKEGG